MRYKIKRWFAGLLSIVMILSMLLVTAMAESVTPTGKTKIERVQALIDELPDAEEITGDNRAAIQKEVNAITRAMRNLTEDEIAELDTTRYDEAVAVLEELDDSTGDNDKKVSTDSDADIDESDDPDTDPVPESSAPEQLQALIDELPETEKITADNRTDVEAQIDAIDEAMSDLTEDEIAELDMTRYDEAVAALEALDDPVEDNDVETNADPDADMDESDNPDADPVPESSPLEQLQALIDALPDPETITADNRADVEAQLADIDEAKLEFEDEDLDALDITRYLAAVEAILALDDMTGANVPMPIAFLEDLPGKGTPSEPYEISTREQLTALREYVNDGNNCDEKYFELTDDIDLDNQEWTPIGTSSAPFVGIFDGGGHTVSGLNIDNSDGNYLNLGLFGYIG